MKLFDAIVDARTGDVLYYLVRSKIEDIERRAALQKAYDAGHLVRPGAPLTSLSHLSNRELEELVDGPKRGLEKVGQKPAKKRGRQRPPGKGRL